MVVGGLSAPAASAAGHLNRPKPAAKVKAMPAMKVTPRRARQAPQVRTVTRRGTGAGPWAAPVTARVRVAPGGFVTMGSAPVFVRGAGTASARSRDVSVTVLADAAARAVSGAGVAVAVSAVTRPSADVGLDVRLDVRALASRGGGNWFSRAHLVQVDGCRLTGSGPTATVVGCASRRALATTRTPEGALTATVSPTAAPLVLALATSASGTDGSYAATPLGPQSSWTAGGQRGEFSWTYPMPVPGAAGSVQPDLGVSYTSGSVDGRTATSNGQPSWVGDGFDLQGGYIERRFVSCGDDLTDSNTTIKTGDLCWKAENATLQLGSHSGPLVRDGSSTRWFLHNGDGTKLEHIGTASTGNDHWVLYTQDGAKYYFGSTLAADGSTDTKSRWTAPVFGNQAGEPCYQAGNFAGSACSMVWRWNLTKVVDVHGNAASYVYTTESNNYGQNNNKTVATYIRGGYLSRIDYGVNVATPTLKPAAQAVFTTSERCFTDTTWTSCASTLLTSTTASHWPDVPFDQICTAVTGSVASPSTGGCKDVLAPAFFTRRRLIKVSTQVASAASTTATYRAVDSWSLNQSFLNPQDATDPVLWLNSVAHTGTAADGTTLAAPTVRLIPSVPIPNRVDAIGDGGSPINRYRLGGIDNGTGGQVSVTYSPQDCTPTDLPAGVVTNGRRCFPVRRRLDATQYRTEWFHKYLVQAVDSSDQTGNQPSTRTYYRYVGNAAWRYDRDDLTPKQLRTWGQWRGYERVQTFTGASPGPWSGTQTTYLRGMDGDCADTSCTTTRSESVPDSRGGTIVDRDHYDGFTREETTYSGTVPVLSADGLTVTAASMGSPVSETLDTPTLGPVLASDSERQARIRTLGETSDQVFTAGGAVQRTTRATTTYNSYGNATEVEDVGDTSVTSDDTCTRSDYAVNGSGLNEVTWLVGSVTRTITSAGTCATTPSYPDDLMSGARNTYDGAASWSPTPTLTRGLPTRAERVSGYTAGIFTYQTKATTSYDALGRPVSAGDGLGRRTTTAYTPGGAGPVTQTVTTRVSSWAAPNQIVTTTMDPGRGSVLTITDAGGRTTTQTYDPIGQQSAVWKSDRPTTATPSMRFTYAFGSSTTPGVVTSQELRNDGSYTVGYAYYDGLGRLVQSQGPSGDFDAGARIVTGGDFDARGLQYREYGPVKTTGTPGSGLVNIAESLIPAVSRTTYDGAERVIEVKVRAGTSGTYRYFTTTTAYDGPTTTVTPPEGGMVTATTTNPRSDISALRQYTTGAGTAGASQVFSYHYRADGRLTRMNDPAGNVWARGYDIQGRQTTEVDPDSGASTTAYDAGDQPVLITDARGRSIATTYDEFGRTSAQYEGTDSTGTKAASWAYDSVRVGLPSSSTRYTGGATYTRSVTGYDGANRATGSTVTVNEPDGPTSAGLNGTYASTMSYNVDGQLKQHIMPAVPGVPTTPENYIYDSLGRPSTMTSFDDYSQSYSAYGEVQRMAFGKALRSVFMDYTYEVGTRRLVRREITREAGTGRADDTTYGYDDVGNVVKVSNTPTDPSVTGGPDHQCFTYDALRHLKGAWTPADGDCVTARESANLGGPAPYRLSWTFDDATGNRLTETSSATTGTTSTTSYTYPGVPSTAAAPNHPHAARSATTTDVGGAITGSVEFSYDDSGSLIDAAGTGASADRSGTYTWDALGLMTGTTGHASGTTSNGSRIYDADGQLLLVKDSTGGAVISAVLHTDPDTEIRHDKSTGTKSVRHSIAAPAGLTIMSTQTITAAGVVTGRGDVAVNDAHGTGELLFDGSWGTVTGVRRSTPYGTPRGGVPSWPTGRGFVNGVDDPGTGLVRLGARDFDPVTGRFLSVDPLLAVGDPGQWNGYQYAGSNPATSSDPSGTIADPEGGTYHRPSPSAPYRSRATTHHHSRSGGGGGGSGGTRGGGSAGGGSVNSTAGISEYTTTVSVTHTATTVAAPAQRKPWYQRAWGWVVEHRAEIAVVVVAVAAGAACGALTAGVGAVACAAAAGALIGGMGYGLATPADRQTAGGYATAIGLGAASSAAGHGAGGAVAKIGATAARRTLATVFNRTATATTQATRTGTQSTVTQTTRASESAGATNKIYSARVLQRMSDEPGPMHNFPGSFDDEIFQSGSRSVKPDYFNKVRPNLDNDSIQYRLSGEVRGKSGTFEIFTRPSTSGHTELIIHRFFRPDY
jgi:RHS repeat-associated protein